MTLRSIGDLEVTCPHPELLHAKLYHTWHPYIIRGSIVFELHDMRLICLLNAATPAWVTNTVPFLVVIGYNHYSGSFEVLQAKVKYLLSVGPARPVPRALNKHYSAHGRLINVPFMYFTQGC